MWDLFFLPLSKQVAAGLLSRRIKCIAGEFKGGTILPVGVSVEKAQHLDLEMKAMAAVATDLAMIKDPGAERAT
jgi:hypothetical protein